MPPSELLLMLSLGAALGFFGGLFGIGGGIIVIPLLVLGFGMEQTVAQGTALVMMVPNLLIAWYRYNQREPPTYEDAAECGEGRFHGGSNSELPRVTVSSAGAAASVGF